MGIVAKDVFENGRTTSKKVDSSPPDAGPVPTMPCGCATYRKPHYSVAEVEDQLKDMDERIKRLWDRDIEMRGIIDTLLVTDKSNRWFVIIGAGAIFSMVTVLMLSLFKVI